MDILILTAALIAAGLITGLAVARRLFVVVRVTGASMLPAFAPDDRVLVRRGASGNMSLDEATWVIKRVAAVPGDAVPESVRAAASRAAVVPAGMLVVLSDNPEGNDSRRWGFVPASRVLGPVVLRMPAHPAPW